MHFIHPNTKPTKPKKTIFGFAGAVTKVETANTSQWAQVEATPVVPAYCVVWRYTRVANGARLLISGGEMFD